MENDAAVIGGSRAIEADLRACRAALAGILMMSSEGILVAGASGVIEVFSTGAEEMFGYRAGEVIGQGIEVLMPARFQGGHRDHVGRFAASSDTSRRMNRRPEIIGLRKNGIEFPISASLSKLDTPGGTKFTLIMRDLTDEKAAMQELLEAKLKAEEANLAKSLFVAGMSHELRTPLNAIIGFAELLAGESSDAALEARRCEFAAEIHASGKHLLKIINDILNVSRIEAGKVTISEDAVSLAEIVDVCRRTIHDQRIAARVEIRGDVPAQVPVLLGDRSLIFQAVLNLVSNAVKFTPAGGCIDIVVRQVDGGDLDIAVHDTGIGMNEETIKRIGEPFLQGDRKLSRRYEGTGLGLVISKRLAELHGGRLIVESALGVGTKMAIRLPASRVRSSAGSVPA